VNDGRLGLSVRRVEAQLAAHSYVIAGARPLYFLIPPPVSRVCCCTDAAAAAAALAPLCARVHQPSPPAPGAKSVNEVRRLKKMFSFALSWLRWSSVASGRFRGCLIGAALAFMAQTASWFT